MNAAASDTLKSISDEKSLTLFNMIALSSVNVDSLAEKLSLTRQQCYSRISALTEADLVKRRNREYSLTSFGKIVYEFQLLIEKAKQSLWKLKAIDIIESSYHHLTVEERRRILDTLVVDDNLKEILVNVGEKEINQPINNKGIKP
jgi:predicted transcriptional regulator